MFEPPPDYTTLGPGRSEPMRDEDDNLLQFAIQQSLLDAGTESDQVRTNPLLGHRALFFFSFQDFSVFFKIFSQFINLPFSCDVLQHLLKNKGSQVIILLQCFYHLKLIPL